MFEILNLANFSNNYNKDDIGMLIVWQLFGLLGLYLGGLMPFTLLEPAYIHVPFSIVA